MEHLCPPGNALVTLELQALSCNRDLQDTAFARGGRFVRPINESIEQFGQGKRPMQARRHETVLPVRGLQDFG